MSKYEKSSKIDKDEMPLTDDMEENESESRQEFNMSNYEALTRGPVHPTEIHKENNREVISKRICHKDYNVVEPDKSTSSNKKKNEKQIVKNETNVKCSPECTTLSDKSRQKLYLALFLIVIIAIVGMAKIFINQSNTLSPFNVDEIMKSLENKFSGQPEMTYLVIKSAVRNAASKNPKAPGIIILLSSKGAKETNNIFAQQLAKLISQSYVSITAGAFHNPDHLKKEIDDTIKNNLTGNNGLAAVLVNNLDQIPFEAAMMFHGYCDDQNAPFKNAVYVMTVSSEEVISPSSSNREWDEIASRQLKAAWKIGGEDQVSSLLSRLTGSVAAIVETR